MTIRASANNHHVALVCGCDATILLPDGRTTADATWDGRQLVSGGLAAETCDALAAALIKAIEAEGIKAPKVRP